MVLTIILFEKGISIEIANKNMRELDEYYQSLVFNSKMLLQCRI